MYDEVEEFEDASSTTEGATTTTSAGTISATTRFRRGLGLLAVLVTVGGFFAARATGHLEDCETSMSRTSGTPVKVERVERCSPLPVETMIPALLVVLALMWPDLTSVELFGLGRIQRRLHDQDIRQTQLEAVQQRLESRIENTLAVQQNPTINFGTSSAAALIAESKVDDDGRRLAEAGGEHGSSSVDQSEALMASVEPIKPWINLARRMNDPGFAAVVDAGAASGSPSDAPGLMRSDVALLRKVERPGHPFDVTALRAWASENSLQLDAVRDTLSAGAQANPESIRVATKFANQLFSDLQRRGLVATA